MYAINIQPFSTFAVGTLAGPEAIKWSQSSPSQGIIAIIAEHGAHNLFITGLSQNCHIAVIVIVFTTITVLL